MNSIPPTICAIANCRGITHDRAVTNSEAVSGISIRLTITNDTPSAQRQTASGKAGNWLGSVIESSESLQTTAGRVSSVNTKTAPPQDISIVNRDIYVARENTYRIDRITNSSQGEAHHIQIHIVGRDRDAIPARTGRQIRGQVISARSRNSIGKRRDWRARFDLRQCPHRWSGWSRWRQTTLGSN